GAAQADSHIQAPEGPRDVPGSGTADVPGKRSLFSRLLHSRIAWIIAAGMLIIILAALLLAEESARERDFFGNTPAPVTATTNSSTTRSEAATTDTTAVTETSATETVAVPDNTGVETTPSGGGTAAPVKIISGYVSPSTVYPRQAINLSSVVNGKALTVTISLAPQSGGSALVNDLVRQSVSGGNEVWGASGTAPAAGNYYIYVQATNADGQVDSLYAGMLVVYPTVY
ncbi:MAG: hypothetical protein WC935_07785, partial [Thermoleophilia bacterium]